MLCFGLSLHAQAVFNASDSLAILQLSERYRVAWLAGDSSGVLNCFEQKARLSPSSLCPVDGLAAMRQFWFPADSSLTVIHGFDNRIVELSGDGDMAFSTQKTWLDWSYFKGPTRMGKEQRGYAHTVYRRQAAGDWKIWRQSWTDVWSRPKPESELGKSAPMPAKWPAENPKTEGTARPKIHIPDDTENIARLKEINRDIWQPFSEAYATNDAEKYLGLHRPDFIRGNGGVWAGLRNLAEYAASVRKNFARNQTEQRKTVIDFTFFERVAEPDLASERGIYRVIYANKDGSRDSAYGQFHVFHRKTNGQWKIAVDYDSDENGSIGPENFEAGWPTGILNAADFLKKHSSQNPATDAEKNIRAAAAQFSELLKKADWDAVADAYTSDARIFPPGKNVVEGRAAIRAVWAASPKITFHKVTPSEIKIIGSEAYDWGVYEGKSIGSDGKESAWKGKYVIVWREASPGDWRMRLDIWNRMD